MELASLGPNHLKLSQASLSSFDEVSYFATVLGSWLNVSTFCVSVLLTLYYVFIFSSIYQWYITMCFTVTFSNTYSLYFDRSQVYIFKLSSTIWIYYGWCQIKKEGMLSLLKISTTNRPMYTSTAHYVNTSEHEPPHASEELLQNSKVKPNYVSIFPSLCSVDVYFNDQYLDLVYFIRICHFLYC